MGGSSGTGDHRLAGVEGLRACAALSVLTYHVLVDVRARPDLGWVGRWVELVLPAGLTLFFALSGFLLFRPIAAALLGGKELPDVGRYLKRRALRILPAYWVILLIAALLLGAARVEPTKYAFGYLTDPALLGQNLLLIQSYSPSSMVTGIPAAWSLCAEVAFYLLLPLLALPAARLAAGRGPRGRLAAALLPAALLLVVGVAGKAWAAATYDASDAWAQEWGASWHAVLERSILASADLFAFGMVAAVVTVAATSGVISAPRARAVGGRLAVYVIPLAVLLRPLFDDRLFTSWMGLGFAGLLTWATLPADGGVPRVVRALERRPVAYVGLISYSVYLWHQPIIVALDRHGLLMAGPAGITANLTLVLGLTFALAALTYRFVEKPANDLGRGTSPARARRRREPLPELT